jgi:hypothetical protein
MTVKRSEKVTKLQPFLRCAERIPADMELEQDDIAWATRSGMWQSRAEKASARRTKRAKARPALILAGHGVSLRVEKGALTIRNGFTHYPQQPQVIRYFRGDVALPERIILLDGSGSVSFDVLPWLAEQKVSLIRIDWKGDIRIKAISDGYDSTIGIMHDGSDGSLKFIFDLMEPQRPKVDRAALEFVKRTVFDPADFTIRNDGVVRLNPQLARHVANLTTRALSFN